MAELAHEDLVARFDDESKESLSKLVRLCLPNQTVPENITSEEFAFWVHDLRKSERDWNRALGVVIVNADDAYANGNINTSVRILCEFVAECPWVPLKDIAEEEASRYRTGGGE